MATQTRVPQVRGYGSAELRGTALGWIGSKLGKKGNFGTITAAGYIDQAAAAGAAVAGTVDVGLLNNNIAAAEAAGSTKCLATKLRIPHDDDIIELGLVNGSDDAVTVTTAMEYDAFGIYRKSDGVYAADQGGSGHLLCVGVNTRRNTVLCKLIEANRLK